ncbi:MAG: alpha/beta hydrolase [Candidatus Acidiferrum sp.]
MHLVTRGSGYPVLFIHGIPTSGQLWTGVVDRLATRFACHAVDLPGFGKTPKAAHGLEQLGALAESLERIRIEQKIEKWHVVGHDAGSAIAVQYAHRFSQSVERLALLSPSVFPELKPFHLFRVLRRPVVGELLAPVVNFLFWKLAMRYALGEKREALEGVVEDFSAPFSGALGAWRLMDILRFGNPAEVLRATSAMLPQLPMPTLVLHGSHDPAVPQAFAERAGASIPNARVVVVDAGHFIPLNNPTVVAWELLRFFNRSTEIRTAGVRAARLRPSVQPPQSIRRSVRGREHRVPRRA